MRSIILFLALNTAMLPLIFGCSQTDPDEGIDEVDGGVVHPPWVWQCTDTTVDEVTEGMSHYPIANGGVAAKWSYRHFGGLELVGIDTLVEDPDSWENITMDGVQYQGATAYVVQDTPTQSGKVTRNWLREKDGVVTRVHKEEYAESDLTSPIVAVNYYLGTQQSVLPDIDYYEEGFKRFDDTWLTKEPGWSEVVSYNRMVTLDLTGTEGNVNQEAVRTHRFTIESKTETVAVPAGTFTGCVRILRERLREPDDNATELEKRSDIKRFWFCPGIGKVKEQQVITDPRTEELLYYCVPGGLCCPS
ncbi:MAG: hypothetical protein QNJ97_27540 [Myxococcota bacterium]|nr:hypothetical protein [Myxococcota bacterium]